MAEQLVEFDRCPNCDSEGGYFKTFDVYRCESCGVRYCYLCEDLFLIFGQCPNCRKVRVAEEGKIGEIKRAKFWPF